jgi:hypothetical protein
VKTADPCREHRMRLKALEGENARLKKLLCPMAMLAC